MTNLDTTLSVGTKSRYYFFHEDLIRLIFTQNEAETNMAYLQKCYVNVQRLMKRHIPRAKSRPADAFVSGRTGL